MNTPNITNYKPKDFAELLGVSVKTLQRWDREGTLKANRTPTDRRYYTYDQYLQFKGINTENDNRQTAIYAKVSTINQKDDLQNQVTFLRQFYNAKGIIVDQCIEDYGSGTVSIKAGRYYVSVLIEISINRQELRNWKRNCVENKDVLYWMESNYFGVNYCCTYYMVFNLFKTSHYKGIGWRNIGKYYCIYIFSNNSCDTLGHTYKNKCFM